MVDLRTDTAADVVAVIRRREVSSREVLAAQVERIERWNPVVNAVVALDLERAMQRAAAADDALVRGDAVGPLHGLPITVKDSFETEGIVTTSGAPEYRDHVPVHDADPVARLAEAGAIVFGKSNVPLLTGDWQAYNEVYGRTLNPWNTERTPGGSSGGSAVTVATGMSALELGSDLGGSIRIPAHFCGVYGHKPTHGLVPSRGHVPGPPGTMAPADLSVVGPLGRSAADLELALDALVARGFETGPGALPPAAAHAGVRPRVALALDDPFSQPAGHVRAVLERAAQLLIDAGAEVVDVPLPTLADGHDLYVELLNAVIAGELDDDTFAAYQRALHDPTSAQHERARDYVTHHRDWVRADERRHRLRARWHDEVFSRVDVVLAPCTAVTACPIDEVTPFRSRTVDVDGASRSYRHTMLAWSGYATLPGLPATAVPVGVASDGLPVGMQVIGDRWADRTCLAVAGLLGAAVGGFVPPPEPR
ncbi:MAG: hypothetical protein RLZ14_391 [Actinomycetota bacterium]